MAWRISQFGERSIRRAAASSRARVVSSSFTPYVLLMLCPSEPCCRYPRRSMAWRPGRSTSVAFGKASGMEGGRRCVRWVLGGLIATEPIRRVAPALPGAAEGEVDALRAQQRMPAFLKRQHAVVAQAVLAAPQQHVAMQQRDALGSVGAAHAAEPEDRRQAQRNGHDGRGEVPLVLV